MAQGKHSYEGGGRSELTQVLNRHTRRKCVGCVFVSIGVQVLLGGGPNHLKRSMLINKLLTYRNLWSRFWYWVFEYIETGPIEDTWRVRVHVYGTAVDINLLIVHKVDIVYVLTWGPERDFRGHVTIRARVIVYENLREGKPVNPDFRPSVGLRRKRGGMYIIQ